jgi:hypothetical protein
VERVVERLIVAVGAKVDRGSMRSGLNAYAGLSSAVFAAGSAIAAFSISQAAAIDENAKAARALALTTEEYTALMFAADRSGVSQGALTSSLGALQRQIQSAGTGSKEAVEDFQALGLAFRDSSGDLRTSADILPDLTEALKDLPDGERLGLQLRLLGRGGATMATLIGEGADGIQALTDRAGELGLVLDAETAAAGERLTDSMTDLKGSLKGMALQLASQTMPGIADFVDGLTDALTQSDGIVQVGLDRAVRAVGFAMDFAATPTGKWAGALVAAGAAVGGIRAAGGLVGGLAKLSPAIAGMVAPLGSALLAAAPFIAVAAVGALVIDDMVVAANGGDSAILALAESLGVGEEAAEGFAAGGSLITTAWDALPGLFSGLKLFALDAFDAIKEGLSQLMIDFPILDTLWEGFKTGSQLAFDSTIGQVQEATEGFALLARYAAGDESVVFDAEGGDGSPVIGGALTEGVASGVIGLATRSREDLAVSAYREAAAMAPGSGVVQGERRSSYAAPVNVSVTVDSADAVARVASREVDGQVRQALTTVDAL